ncbi:MAG: ASKHA domain-containing protein [Vicinamibacteria bacterium]|nr:ASKHA domain-containing protein [Vicinamibacteria bacterium]
MNVSGATGLRIAIDGHVAEAQPGQSLFECAEGLGVRVPTSCVKQGKCRECLVEVEAGAELLSAPAPQESHLGGRFRLSCRARIEAGAGEIRCHTLRRGTLRVETESLGLDVAFPLEPAVTRAGDTVLLDGVPIATGPGPLLGLAIDVGTTTVAVRLHDLGTGARLATQSFENPQRFGGSEVMARIRYDGEHPGRLLQRTLLGYLGRAIEALPCDPHRIFEVVVVGNPTMRDLFFGLDVGSIGVLPYRSHTEEELRDGRRESTALATVAKRLRLPVHPEARVYGLPLIGSHVGADAAACLLATGLAEREALCAVLDIGTNTEVLVGNRHRLLAASCPAGPAFEGGGVACGMPALDGAIERVALRPDGSFAVQVIGAGRPGGSPHGTGGGFMPAPEPVGICGSGLVDLLSELSRTGRMNAQGRFDHDEHRIDLDASGRVFVAEADVNELAQAKGANVAGLRLVLEAFGASLDQVETLYLAGGFARHLDPTAAMRIGLIPQLPLARVAQVGNAALEGASQALLSLSRRRFLEDAVKRVEHVRLESAPSFFDVFVDGCQFEPWGAVPA